MSTCVFNNIVKYACACGLVNPISDLYFCRHCLNLRCGFCLCHEVDSHFCNNCLENIPSSEAKHKKYRCNICFNCPSCQHALSTRGTTVVVPATKKSTSADDDTAPAGEAASSASATPAETKTATKKMFYLCCLACRWTSRDVGIPDQPIASGSWPEPEYIHATRFAQLMEYHQSIVLQEKQEKQELWRRKTPKSKFPSLTDRTGVSVSMVRRQLGWTGKVTTPKVKVADIKPSEATKAENDLPVDIFTKPISLKKFTTIDQRLAQPMGQPYTVNNLIPQHSSLSIKRSLRCRQCEHNIIKPEFNPISIKYRIQLFASYHIPEVRLIRADAVAVPQGLKNHTQCPIQLRFVNPTIYDMTITMLELPTDEEEELLIDEMRRCAVEKKQAALAGTGGGGGGSQSNSLNTSLSLRQISLNEDPRVVGQRANARIILPDSSFVVNYRDESLEYDEEVVQKDNKDPKFIVSRKSNKVAIRVDVVPEVEFPDTENVIVGFTVQFTHHVNNSTNLTTTTTTTAAGGVGGGVAPNLAAGGAGGNRDSQVHALTSRVYVDLGKLSSA